MYGTGWRSAWRNGFIPNLSNPALVALRDALVADDPRLIQGKTTDPPPLAENAARRPVGACALGFCGWVGEGLTTVGSVSDFFDYLCAQADAATHPLVVQEFLLWYDNAGRAEVWRGLRAEVERAIRARGLAGATTGRRSSAGRPRGRASRQLVPAS